MNTTPYTDPDQRPESDAAEQPTPTPPMPPTERGRRLWAAYRAIMQNAARVRAERADPTPTPTPERSP